MIGFQRGRVRKISLWLLTSNQLFPGPPGLPFCQGANWHFLRCLEPLARLPLEYDNGGCLDLWWLSLQFLSSKGGRYYLVTVEIYGPMSLGGKTYENQQRCQAEAIPPVVVVHLDLTRQLVSCS